MKIAQNALFRSCGARFGKIAFLSVKVLKIVTLAVNSLPDEITARFPWKLYKTLFSGHAQHVLAKSQVKLLKIVTYSQILAKTGKQCAFHEYCTKRSFQVMRSTFWPNRIFERQRSHNRHTGLTFSPKTENSTLFMNIVQNALFRSCGARFGQIALLSAKVLTIVTHAWNLLQNGKTARFSWKFYKTLFSAHAQHVLTKSHFWASKFSKIVTLASYSLQKGKTVRFSWKLHKTLFSDHAQHVLVKSHFWAPKFSKSSHCPKILAKTGKQCAFHKNCTKRYFQVMGSTFWPNGISERQSSQNRHTGLKFSSRRKNSALSMKIVQNALFRSCAARFGQIAFLRAKLLKIVTLSQILAKTGKQCAFHENCTKRSFQLTRSTFWPNRIFERQSSKNRYTCLKFSPKRQHNALYMKILQNALFRSCAARFGQIAFLSGKVVKVVKLASNSLQNGKTVRFPCKLYKTLFSGHAQHVLAKSHFWASKFS